MIETVKISSDNTEIKFTAGPVQINEITIWVNDTYKKTSKAINIPVPAIDPVTNTYTIFANQLSLNSFDGIFFIEFKVSNILESILVVVGNFTKYYECLLDKVLKLELAGCGKVESDCKDCDKNNSLQISSLLTALEIAVTNSYYKDAAKIVETLNSLCEICHNCPSDILPVVEKYLLSYDSTLE